MTDWPDEPLPDDIEVVIGEHPSGSPTYGIRYTCPHCKRPVGSYVQLEVDLKRKLYDRCSPARHGCPEVKEDE